MGGGPIEMLRRRSSRNVLGTLFISAGMPMLLGGDEMGRTQEGNNNSYCQDSSISWYDWDLAPWQRDLLATASFLVELRESHPVLRPESFATGSAPEGDTLPDLSWYRADGVPMDTDAWHDPWTRVIQMLRNGGPLQDNDLLVIINGWLDQVDVTLPDGHGTDWHLSWDSTWAVPRPHTSAFALARRVSRGAARTRVIRPTKDRPQRSAECRHDRPGDTTTLDALSMRIYMSGEVLEPRAS
jgi:possible isoamylase